MYVLATWNIQKDPVSLVPTPPSFVVEEYVTSCSLTPCTMHRAGKSSYTLGPEDGGCLASDAEKESAKQYSIDNVFIGLHTKNAMSSVFICNLFLILKISSLEV